MSRTAVAAPPRRRAAVGTFADGLDRLRPSRHLGVRARLILAFTLGSFLSSALLAGVTWALVRDNLISSRVSAAVQGVFTNAKQVRDSLPQLAPGESVPDLLRGLGASPDGARPVLIRDGQPLPAFPEFGAEALPASLRSAVESGRTARMRHTIDGEPNLSVGVPLPAVDADYYEIVSLVELEDTLNSLSVALVGAGLVTTMAGAGIGWWMSRRVLRPLAQVGHAAEAIAGGNLDTRLQVGSDPDLAPLAASFNEMAQGLQDRIERDARFASDVSHELRSPLMTLAASIEVLQSRRHELPERAQRALDLMVDDVARFQTLVEDLLEISRIDAGAARLQLDETLLPELVLQAVAASSDPDVAVSVDAGIADLVVEVDKRRLVRVIANLIDNAKKYGGGAVGVSLRQVPGGVEIAVEDAGPGVPPEERDLVFERFARGGVAGRRGAGEGVGLGLALVAEHVRLHGGTVRARAAALVLVALATVTAVTAGCGVPEDEGAITIPSDDVPFELASPAAQGPTEPESSGNLTAVVYFVDTGEQRLTTVSRRVETRASVDERLDALLGDLSQEELDRGLTTYIADGTALVSPPRLVENGVIVLDFNAAFTEGQASADHLIAVAQVVWTVTDIQGIRAVLFQRDGETQRELTGEGEQVPRPLDRGDFLDLRPQDTTTTSAGTSTTAARGGG